MSLHVLFKVADADYTLRASDVLHMESYTGATRVPGSMPHVAGLVQIRGRVIPVVDLRARFGLPAVPATLDTRVLVVASGARVVGMLADSAREIMHIEPDLFRPPPDIVTQQALGYVTAVAQVGKRLIMLMDFERVIGEEVLNGDHEARA